MVNEIVYGKVALLSIGTEITTGQILNKNVQSLSIDLLKLGIGVCCHLTVPDETQLIKSALEFLQKQAQVLIITGGLGPTADDFTRKVLAEHYHLPLQWDEANWQKVQSKLKSKGVTIRELHKQQCEFPLGAEVLANNAGVADGFTFKTSTVEVYALPGPPKELADLWENHLRYRLATLIPEPLQWVQLIWTTTGLPESEVAARVNEALGEAGTQVLYRVHSPCVDVKLLFQKKDAEAHQQLGALIRDSLAPWLLPETK